MRAATDALPDGAVKVRNSIGFTWTKIPDGKGGLRWLMPEDLGYSEVVGWACIAFAERWLQQDGKPLQLTNEQMRMLLWINAVDPVTLSFVFPVSALVRIKGAGKDLLQAIMCLFELCGNARPTRDAYGNLGVQAVRRPWVIVAATGLEQTYNTSGYFADLLTSEAIDEFGISLGKEVTFTAVGGRMESVTSNPKRIEGQRPTFQSATEAGLWVESNQGSRMFGAMERGAAKVPGCRILLSSNAYAVGEDSVLEMIHQDYEAIEDGRMADTGINYDSLSAPADTNIRDVESLRHGIDQARGDAWWLDVDAKLKVALAGRTSVESTYRFELNINASADDALYEAPDWDQGKCEIQLNQGDTITLGLDVSLRDDATALVAMRVEDRAAFSLRIVERPTNADDTWCVDMDLFDDALADAFERFDVVGFYSDVNPVQGHVERWERQYGEGLQARFTSTNPVQADMRFNQKRLTAAHESLHAAIQNGQLIHDGDRVLRRHVLNAHRRINRHGLSFGKASKYSPRKIDAYAALLLADLARTDYLLTKPKPQKKPGRLLRLQ